MWLFFTFVLPAACGSFSSLSLPHLPIFFCTAGEGTHEISCCHLSLCISDGPAWSLLSWVSVFLGRNTFHSF